MNVEITERRVLVCWHGRSRRWWRTSWCAMCWEEVARNVPRRGRDVLCVDCATTTAVDHLTAGGAVAL